MAKREQHCTYCDRGPARLAEVHEPTDGGEAYRPVLRVVCEGCEDAYRRAPWGFPVTDRRDERTGVMVPPCEQHGAGSVWGCGPCDDYLDTFRAVR